MTKKRDFKTESFLCRSVYLLGFIKIRKDLIKRLKA